MKQIDLEMRDVPVREKTPSYTKRLDMRLSKLEEDFMIAAGNAHNLELKSAEPYREGQYAGSRETFTKAAQMVREIRRELNGSRVKDSMSRR